MEIDSLDTAGEAAESSNPAHARLNSWVAITVALLATFVAISKVKDDHIVQAMHVAQADKIDHWSFYQARNIRQEVAQSSLDAFIASRGTAAGLPATQRAQIDSTIARYKALVADQSTKKDSLRVLAESDQKTYDALNYRDDQFGLSEALLALAISLLALTALTHKRWLFWVALVPTALGALMGLAGIFGWPIHPDAITRLLS